MREAVQSLVFNNPAFQIVFHVVFDYEIEDGSSFYFIMWKNLYSYLQQH